MVFNIFKNPKPEKAAPDWVQEPSILSDFLRPAVLETIHTINAQVYEGDKWNTGYMNSRQRARLILSLAHSAPKRTVEMKVFEKLAGEIFTQKVRVRLMMHLEVYHGMQTMDTFWYKYYMHKALESILRDCKKPPKDAADKTKQDVVKDWLKSASDAIPRHYRSYR